MLYSLECYLQLQPASSQNSKPLPLSKVVGLLWQIHGGYVLHVSCKLQEQIDALWEKLSEGGVEQPCGWLKDKYRVSGQTAPFIIWEIAEGTRPS